MNRWFSRWDRDVSRLVLCPGVALDLDLPAIWVMVVGPPGGGKTENSVELAKSYVPHVSTSDISEAGLLSMEKGTKGKGVLSRLGKKSLWVMADFSSIISLREETRAKIASALREIYDGRWSRNLRGSEEIWVGQCGLVAACTNAIEKYHKLQKELGDRFVQVRTSRIDSRELRIKASNQQGHRAQMKEQIQEAGQGLLLAHNGLPEMTDESGEVIAALADFCAFARQSIGRDYRGQVYDVQEAESGGRLWQQFSSIAQADACLLGQTVGQSQLELLFRIAIDSAPLSRARILKLLCAPGYPSMTQADLFRAGNFEWRVEVGRALEELEIAKLVTKDGDQFCASERAIELTIGVVSNTYV